MGETAHNEPPIVDAKPWNGHGFWSSGFIEPGDAGVVFYRMRITKPGTYKFACLIRPPMVGTLKVTR
jgi:hypothetical protein